MSAATSSGYLHGRQLRRLMAEQGLTQRDVAALTGVAPRTVQSIVEETARPHPRTLQKLAAGLDVSIDELFAPRSSAAAAFDRRTNPAVAEAIAAHPELFRDWTPAEFDELFSRVAVGGEQTESGALAAAAALNDRRELLQAVALLLETDQADLLRDFIALLRRRTELAPTESTAKAPPNARRRPRSGANDRELRV
ncbi:MAG: helix-turn-helix transcriptional regulator [Pirellulales bacterium]|nr:helix-turn-helix transcriptional regulator [Pirellulales bacterium]